MGLFSLLKRVFGEKKGNDEPKEETSNISDKESGSKQRVFNIESVVDFLEKKFDENFQLFKKDVETSYDEIQSKLNDFKDSLTTLEKAKIGEDIDAEILRINLDVISLANAHKKSFIEKMRMMTNQLNKPLGSDSDSILNYQQSTLQSVAITNERTLKEYILFKDKLEKESGEAVKKFQLLYDAVRKFDYSVNKKIGDVLSVKKSQEKALDIRKSMEILVGKKSTIGAIDENLIELEIKRKFLEENLKKLDSDEIYLSFIKSRDYLESEMSKVKSDVYQNFSLIEKPLKRFRYLIGKDVEKIETDDGKILERFLDSPVDTLIETDNLKSVNSILDEVQAYIVNGKLDVKNREKILEEIKRMTEQNIFKELILRYNSLQDELNRLEKSTDVQNILNSKNTIQADLERTNRDIETNSTEIEKTKKLIEKLDFSIGEKTDDLKKIIYKD